jgi:asparagine synthase (glutamine-hydrolysing)
MFYLPFDILTKVDRASMHFGLEVRSPLLGNEVVNYSFSEFGYRDLNGYGGNKAPLRFLVKNKLPETEFSRPKRGFGFPINRWLSNELKSLVLAETDSLPKILEGCVDHKRIKKIVSDFMDGHHTRGDDVWRAMCLYRWGRNFEYSL